MTRKSKTRVAPLPRKRSADALSLQSARHRQRVIPNKKRAAREPTQEELRAIWENREIAGALIRAVESGLDDSVPFLHRRAKR